MTFEKMTAQELRSVFSLSTIMALRMLGLFMILPLFALYATDLPGATPYLVGAAMGIYGLTQALFQLPFGTLSDYLGRKKIITLGLSIFILGSAIVALSDTIWGVIIGRALQGAGAVGSTIMALISDLTRVEQRTKAMAISGMTIGISFSVSMMLGPLLAAWMDIHSIFWLAAFLSMIGIVMLFTWVPDAPSSIALRNGFLHSAKHCLHAELFKLNIGIFLLHIIFTASFIVIPIALQTKAHLHSQAQWLLYLPILFTAFCISIPCIMFAEKKNIVKKIFCASIFFLAIAEFLFWIFPEKRLLFAGSLLLFFIAFSLLEAFLPSLVSKIAPSEHKGTALGIYSFSQFLGIFVGGVLGGWLYGTLGLMQVNLFCAFLAIVWLAIAFQMKNPQYSRI